MLTAWMKSLVIYLILSGLIMKLIPGKNYTRYISFFMGIIMIIIIADPIISIFNLKEGDVDVIKRDIEEYMSVNSFGNSGYVSKDEDNYYNLSLNEAIKYECNNNGYKVSNVSVITDTDNNVLSCMIYIQETYDEKNIKNLINDVYKIDLESIYIVRR